MLRHDDLPTPVIAPVGLLFDVAKKVSEASDVETARKLLRTPVAHESNRELPLLALIARGGTEEGTTAREIVETTVDAFLTELRRTVR